MVPKVLWGLETVPLTASDRGRLATLQRTMVHRILQLPQRASETATEFFKRRERCCSATIHAHARASWAELQLFRRVSFAGHLARLCPHTHLAAAVFEWRSDAWWERYKLSLPPKTGGQTGRRAGDAGTPGQMERTFRQAFEEMRQKEPGAPALQLAYVTLGTTPTDWRHMAQAREAWRLFIRQACIRDAAKRGNDEQISTPPTVRRRGTDEGGHTREQDPREASHQEGRTQAVH